MDIVTITFNYCDYFTLQLLLLDIKMANHLVAALRHYNYFVVVPRWPGYMNCTYLLVWTTLGSTSILGNPHLGNHLLTQCALNSTLENSLAEAASVNATLAVDNPYLATEVQGTDLGCCHRRVARCAKVGIIDTDFTLGSIKALLAALKESV